MRPQDVVERALESARGDGCVVVVTDEHTANLRWANNTVTSNGISTGRRVAVVAVVNGAAGRSAAALARSTTGDPQEVVELVRAAEDAARGNPPAEDAEALPAGDADGGWSAAPGRTGPDALAPLVAPLGDAFTRATAEGVVLYGYAEHTVSTTYLGTSTGLRRRHEQPTGTLDLTGRAPGTARSAWGGTGGPRFTSADVALVGEEVRRRLDWSTRQVELPAGRYEVLLPPGAVGDLMTYLYWSMAARAAHEGRSVFASTGGGTRVGERLASSPLTMHSDPAQPGLDCTPFVVATASTEVSSVFDNGLPLGRTEWIADGRLAALVQTRHTARLTGLPVTPVVDNLVLAGSADGRSLTEMIRGTRRGLLLTCLWYIREVDPQTLLLTGLTRDGVFLVEDGEVVGAVNNFRFNESPVDLLGRATEVGASGPTLPREFQEWMPRMAMPPLRVAEFNMSSVSPAY